MARSGKSPSYARSSDRRMNTSKNTCISPASMDRLPKTVKNSSARIPFRQKGSVSRNDPASIARKLLASKSRPISNSVTKERSSRYRSRYTTDCHLFFIYGLPLLLCHIMQPHPQPCFQWQQNQYHRQSVQQHQHPHRQHRAQFRRLIQLHHNQNAGK